VSTFLIPVSLGVASFRWQPPAPPPISFLALSGVVWCSAVVLFVLFTRLTYQEMESARKKRDKLADGISAGSSSTLHPRSDIASYLLALLTIAYGALMIHLGHVECWHFAPWTTVVHAKTHSIACTMPALTIVIGLLAFLFTVGQKELK
jgi:polyferredoxin